MYRSKNLILSTSQNRVIEVQTCDPSIWGEAAGGSVQGHSQSHRELEASLGYVTLYLKNRIE